MKITTSFLIAANSFLSGMGRVLDLGSTRNDISYNNSKTELEADSKALFNDWAMVGQDMREIIKNEKLRLQ